MLDQLRFFDRGTAEVDQESVLIAESCAVYVSGHARSGTRMSEAGSETLA
jgi:hypothetical protein